MKARVTLLLILLVTAPLAGCFGKGATDEENLDEADDVFTNETLRRVERVAGDRTLAYQFPGADPAERSVVRWFNDTIGTEANTGYENPQDRGGSSINTLILTEDFSSLVPQDQPTLIDIRLWYDNKPGASADLDIFVDGHEVRTHENREYHGEVAWTLPVKTKSVATIGLEETLIGVQAANGRVLPGRELPFWMRIEFLYGDNVAAPKVPYALDVPRNATGLIVESVKFAGDTHVQGRFVIVGPDDRLVTAVDFDDLSIPTQSIYVPVPASGTYVFYVVDVKNGFFKVSADAPLEKPDARPLTRTVEDVVLITEPVAPGSTEHAWTGAPSSFQQGASADFSVDGAFPLEVTPMLFGDGFTGDVQLRVTNGKGLVSEYHRFLRYDTGHDAVGVSDDGVDANRAFHPGNLATGDHTLEAAVNGMSGLEAGVRIVSYGP